jgi:hypothetical protein
VACFGTDNDELRVITVVRSDHTITHHDTKVRRPSTDEAQI